MKQLNTKVLIFLVLILTFCMEPMGKVCPGTNNGMSISVNRESKLGYMMKRFTNCTKIEGNLEVSGLPLSNVDLSFLSTIEEVTGYVLFYDTSITTLPLTNLKLIRGDHLFEQPKGKFGLVISKNVALKELGLNSLAEISHGNAWFASNGELCYVDTVLWSDIFYDVNSTLINYNASGEAKTCYGNCHESCPKFNGKSYCWGPGDHQCQKLTKALCHEGCKGRCFGKEWNQCCSETCAGGCTGTSNKECFKCKTFSDGDTCVEFCPPPAIYDPVSMTWKSNPMFKYHYGYECVSQCPDYMYVDKGACVRNCPVGETDTEGVCKPCEGSCPKDCPGTIGGDFLNNRNIESFRGCTVVQGNLYIGKGSFVKHPNIPTLVPLTYDNLTLLENVTLIVGSVKIDGESPHFHNLSFLRNLKTVMANRPYSTTKGFVIQYSSLESLGLDSLQSVLNGNLTITKNKNLCYVEKFDWKLIRKNSSAIFVQNNKDNSECEREGKMCHQECAENSCLGPLDSQCHKCRSYKQENRCVGSCGLQYFSLSSEDGSKECLKCHKECRASCFGPGSDKCHKCLHFKDGPTCVESCPEGSRTCRKKRKPKVRGGRRPTFDELLRQLTAP